MNADIKALGQLGLGESKRLTDAQELCGEIFRSRSSVAHGYSALSISSDRHLQTHPQVFAFINNTLQGTLLVIPC